MYPRELRDRIPDVLVYDQIEKITVGKEVIENDYRTAEQLGLQILREFHSDDNSKIEQYISMLLRVMRK